MELSYIHPTPPYPPLLGPTARARGERMNLFERWLDVRLGCEMKDEVSMEGFGIALKDVGELLEWSGWGVLYSGSARV